MSITAVTEEYEAGSEFTDELVAINSFRKTATRRFMVEFNTNDPGGSRPALALGSSSVPALGAIHISDPTLFVKRRECRPFSGKSPILFEVLVYYESLSDPLAADPVVEWRFATSNEPIDKDQNDLPIVNSSDEPFDPPVLLDIDDLVLSYVRNESAFLPDVAAQFKNATNEDWFLGFEPGKSRCSVIEGRRQLSDASNYYWQVRYEFVFRKDGWKRRIMDQGFRIKALSGSEWTPGAYTEIVDSNNKPITQAALLNGEGQKQTATDGAGLLVPVFREFDVYKAIPFTPLLIAL